MNYETVTVTQDLCQRSMCNAITRDELAARLGTDAVTAGFSCSAAGYVGNLLPCDATCLPYLGDYNARMAKFRMSPVECFAPTPAAVPSPAERKEAEKTPLPVALTSGYVTPRVVTMDMIHQPRCESQCGFSRWVSRNPMAAGGLLLAAFLLLKENK